MLGNVVFGIQCRMGSTRLPGKVLKKLNGKELILHLYDNLLKNDIPKENIYFLIANTDKDIELQSFIKAHGFNYIVGSETDVYSRYQKLAEKIGADRAIVRLTGDNPFIDLRVVEQAIYSHLNQGVDFTSTRVIDRDNKVNRYVSKGNSVDIFNASLLLDKIDNLTEFDKEHVIPSLYRRTTVNLVKESSFDFDVQESISVDTEDDFNKLQSSKMIPDVYIYILNHNYSKYFERCFNSLLEQTYSNIKLVVYDDGSSDGSQSLITDLCERHGIEYVLNEKSGFMPNVRQATSNVKAKYFMRVDADDYCEPTLVETLVELLESNENAGLAFPNYDEVDELENVLTKVERFNFQDNVTVFDLPAHGACTLIRTEFFNAVGGYSKDIEKQDGYDLWLKFHGKYEVCNTSKELFHYRQHSSNLTKNNRSLLIARSKIYTANYEGNLESGVTCVIPVRKGELTLLGKTEVSVQGEDYSFKQLLNNLSCSKHITRIVIVSSDITEKFLNTYPQKVELLQRPSELERSGKSVIETIEWLKHENQLDTDNVVIVNPSYIFSPVEYIDGFLSSVSLFKYDVSFSFCFNNSLLYQHSGKGLEPMYSSEIRRENDVIFERKGLFTYLNLGRMNESDKRIGHFEIDKLSSYSIQEFSNLFGIKNEKN